MAGSLRHPVSHSEAPPVLSSIPLQRIALTGFMGAGKSTVGQLLAQRLNWRFVDADDEIETAAGATIATIFARQGELRFRELEHKTIRRLANSDRVVLALGGGAIEDHRTRSLLLDADATLLIHLEATLETVLLRCQGTENLRPILQDGANLEARYNRRLPLYRQSHLTIGVDSLSPDAVVDAVLAQIGTQSES